jgi:class 3 adenylate cyclase/tetratricopeptide (TPR) repeat protein
MPETGSFERAAALHADVVGYTRHLSDDPEGTIATLGAYRGIISDALADRGGRLGDFIGDSFLALFPDSKSAIAAAVSISLGVKSDPGPVPLRFRMGIDEGDVVVMSDGRAFGDAINIAARIQAITEVGGINVSEAVYEALDEPEMRFRPLGARRFKNVPGEVRVYELQGIAEPHRSLRPRIRPSLAVFAFPATPGHEHLAEAIRLDLLTHLVRMPGLDVIEPDGRAERDGSDAAYFLEGGLQVVGGRLRVYVQLVEMRTFNRLWAERWEAKVEEVFELQDQVGVTVARWLETELIIGEPSRLYREALEPRLVDLVYRGWSELAKPTVDGLRAAIAAFDEVSAASPDEPTGYSLSAFARWYGVLSGVSDSPTRDLIAARDMATRIVHLDDPSGLSQMVRAALALYEAEDLEGAIADAEVAVARRPTCDLTFGIYASVERYRGNWEAAVAASHRAIELSPTPRPWFETTLAGAYFAGGRYREAADVVEALSVTGNDSLESMLLLAASQQALGQTRSAARTVATARERYPGARRASLVRIHPFRDPEVIERWQALLEEAGLP